MLKHYEHGAGCRREGTVEISGAVSSRESEGRSYIIRDGDVAHFLHNA